MLLRFYLVLVAISIHLTLRVSSSEAELLWRLTNQAVQTKPLFNFWKPKQNRPPWTAIPQSFMEALDSITNNDVLHCVPRLLCELMSGQTQTSKDLALPLNINAESLFGTDDLWRARLPISSNEAGRTFLGKYGGVKRNTINNVAVVFNNSNTHTINNATLFLGENKKRELKCSENINDRKTDKSSMKRKPLVLCASYTVKVTHDKIAYYNMNILNIFLLLANAYLSRIVLPSKVIKVYIYSVILHSLISASVNSPSPIVTFGQAALLGYTSKGDTTSCYQAYPTCPKDPEKLMQYLNNYNGGFFRLFSGVPATASKRILNNDQIGDQFTFHVGLRSPKMLTFPNEKDVTFQRPPIGHVKVPMVFPDRTGTGELKLDVSELGTSGNELYPDYNRLKFNKVFRFPVEDF